MNREKWLSTLANNLILANSQMYAGDGPTVHPERTGHKELEWVSKDDLWVIRDSYAGSLQAPGSTYVLYKDRPAWVQSYGGRGMFPQKYELADETFEFLKKALLAANPNLPYRGPSYFKDGPWHYEFYLGTGRTNLTAASWSELIWHDKHSTVFEQDGIAGIVVSRDKETRAPVYPWNL